MENIIISKDLHVNLDVYLTASNHVSYNPDADVWINDIDNKQLKTSAGMHKHVLKNYTDRMLNESVKA